MKKFFEGGQGVLVFVLLGAIVVAVVYFGLLANQRSIAEGAEAIGDAVGNAIDDTAEEQEWRNIDWQVQHGTVVSFWVNHQRIWANKHSVSRHQDDAHKSAQCYNDHGAFMSLANNNLDFYLPCREEDGTVRLTIWRRESATSNRFHMVDAYTPKNGIWKNIEYWLRNTHKATKASFPKDALLVIDSVVP
jgi:hypothetical protein